MRLLALAVATLAVSAPVAAQTADDHLAAGDSLHDALDPAAALEHYRAAFALESSADAAWRFARSQVDVAKQLQDRRTAARRDSLYNVATLYAKLAVRLDSTLADAHFALALALGQLSRTKGGKERVQFGREIYSAAARALELDPNHDGAHHVMGAWHAEVLRLSGVTRFLARTLLGADFMALANWDSATAHLERAVAIRPEHVFHRRELGEIYADTDRPADAITQLERATSLAPTTDVLDPLYQREAAELLARLREREDR